ncbi:hypothetical protein Cme02nite_42020 [Catellatospora methionotrophica]|uniref:YbaB/EbfC DNA-binding family protein n=1 Tax=Catellatospora methionotrophica TaxID=121620 RepID=A0A8J3LNC2_9ACTN|nr:YbaB/EbfC family nucleoid-associated protein [Catellatospora methionotrophica]GIG15870.1 hypothetical protein Cme02nite_42020 [Catellatospora methionotrophica]
MFGDPEEGYRRVDDWQAAIEARAARARELAQRQSELGATVSVAEGSVTATVDHSGRLTTLKLDDRVRGWSLEKLSRTVIEANDAARQAVRTQLDQLIDEAGLRDAP